MPFYNTPRNLFIGMLSSIASQNIIETVKTTIIDDCSTDDISDIILSFKNIMDVEYIRLPKNVGSGEARQYGLNHTDCQYVSFIDSDDQFYSPYSLYLLLKKIQENNYDFVTGGFIQECNSPDKINPLSSLLLSKFSTDNSTWIWSRLFSRDFLCRNDIHFPKGFRFQEDIVFMQQVLDYTTNHTFINNTVYIWHNNTNSLTRSLDSEYMKNCKNSIGFVDALSYSHKLRRERNLIETDNAKKQATDGICMSYWYLVKALAENTNEDCEKLMSSLQKYYNLITEDYPNLVSSDLLKQSYCQSIDTANGVIGQIIPNITLWDMLNDLEENKNTVDDISEYGYDLA